MPPTMSGDSEAVTVERTKQIFRFLKAFAERNVPVRRRVSEHHWIQWLRELPDHPSIKVGEVQLAGSADVPPGTDAVSDQPLITVERPRTTDPPAPPSAILDFLQPGWNDPDKGISILEYRNVVRNGTTSTERFDADVRRVHALAAWQSPWNVWAEAERPARHAMRIFERFYELKGRIDRESESVELMLGDGRLRWANPSGQVDHPLVVQRVELVFDADVPEFRIVDTDRELELYGAILQDRDSLAPQQLNALRSELEKGGYHPLARDGTTGFLKRVVQTLASGGEFDEITSERPLSAQPRISRDAILFLRDRSSGFPAAFDRVLHDLEQGAKVPISITRLVGVEPPVPDESEPGEWSPWGEPPDVLLSKAANEEQIHIARAIDRHGAILVQGPPGTGKSHTIANLIGHLVANGKRVLVTSQTTKALRVLRGHIVDTLKPLCVALLDNDLEGRTQMEEAVKGILSRLTTSNPSSLEADVAQLAETRSELNRELARISRDLLLVREAEYTPIVIGGESLLPSQAARWSQDNQRGNEWIPGPLVAGAPLPLSRDELAELYATNVQLSRDEEDEILNGLPDPEMILAPDLFCSLIEASDATVPQDLAGSWDRPGAEEDLPMLRRLSHVVSEAVEQLTVMQPWQRAIIAAGHSGGDDAQLWRDLAAMAKNAAGLRQAFQPNFVQFDPQLPRGRGSGDAVRLSREIESHLEKGGSLGAVALLLHSDWKSFLREARCNGRHATTAAELRALRSAAELGEAREALRLRWARLAEPAGLPSYQSFGESPEATLYDFATQFDGLLAWWSDHWSRISNEAISAGFRWQLLRNREVARSTPLTPFERDVAILADVLPPAVKGRVTVAEGKAASRILVEFEKALAPYTGMRCEALKEAVEFAECEEYVEEHARLRALIDKRDLSGRRSAFLEKLLPVAPEWARAIRARLGDHAKGVPPGDVTMAWRWRQLAQETERRAALDEVELGRQLRERQAEIREVTATTIDRRAWLGQIRRIDLPARQALQGWAQTQKRIGKGTGKRVPALQVEARRLLDRARDAVPVWIMPLSRVAESFDATKGKFDVVIVDEASQSDVTGLLAWYLGERIAIVGDHEQVSPLAVGQQIGLMTELISQHLMGVPNNHLYDGQLSIYDLARQCFGGTIALREHFRCTPDIIDFSNFLSYNGEIRPLRDPTRVPRPHTLEYVVRSDEIRTDKRNLAEARVVVAIVAALSELPHNKGRTMGAISLVGDEQAGLIQELALQVLGAVELERLHFAAGNAAQFQGDERDIMLLSMVDTPTGSVLPLRQTDIFKQRYNVAASRAKDQMWLVHSLDPNRDLQGADLRRRLIEHVRDPAARRGAIQKALSRAESPFEQSVLKRLISEGYRVEPQVWVGQHRIDIVVSDDNGQVALECDGDRFHGVDKIPADMARQAILERAGWRFIRVRGTRYYRRQEETAKWIFAELARLGVRTSSRSASFGTKGVSDEFRDRVVRRSWEVMREQGWTT